jgi:hypothetical protein
VKDITIAFDVDGTLRDNTVSDRPVANERIRTLLITLASMKNTKIIVWSGGGELYCRQIAAAFGIEKYVDGYEDKQWRPVLDCRGGAAGGEQCSDPDDHNHFGTSLRPDIAIDDMHDFTLANVNLIVREK